MKRWALTVAAFLVAWAFALAPAEPPCEVWGDLAAACSLLPPPDIFPGVWRAFARALANVFGVGGALAILRALGPLALGAVYLLAVVCLDVLLPTSTRLRRGESRQRAFVAAYAPIVAALFFALSGPIWAAGRFFGPATLETLVLLGATASFFRFLSVYAYGYLIGAGVLSALLAADSPFVGFALVLAMLSLVSYLGIRSRRASNCQPLGEPIALALTQRTLTFSFVLAYALSVALIMWRFGAEDGFNVFSLHDSLAVALHFSRLAVRQSLALAGHWGWLVMVTLAVLPLVLSGRLVRRACDEEHFVSFSVSLAFLALGIFVTTQFARIPALWCWRWAPGGLNGVLLTVFLFCLAIVADHVLLTTATDSLVRDYSWLSGKHFDVTHGPGARFAKRARSTAGVAIVLATPVVIALFVAIAHRSPREREMRAIVADYVRLFESDSSGVPIAVTDGHFDGALLLKHRCERGEGDFRAFAFLGDDSPRARSIRTAGEKSGDDSALMAQGAMALLAGWQSSSSPRLNSMALQFGYENLPASGYVAMGTLVRTDTAVAAPLAAKSVADARAIAERVIALGPSDSSAVADTLLAEKIDCISFRLARQAHTRAACAETRGDGELAKSEEALEERLNSVNSRLKKIHYTPELLAVSVGGGLTPREGLRLTLERRDYALARTFARKVLADSPRDAVANYAMAMSFAADNAHSQAIEYFRLALDAEAEATLVPVILNNMAISEMLVGNYSSASSHAERACGLLPGNAAVRGTLADIRDAEKAMNRQGEGMGN